MDRIRLTQRRRLLTAARERAEARVRKAIAPEFKRQFKKLEHFLRKGNFRKRLEKTGKLSKRYKVIPKDGKFVVMNIDKDEPVPGGEHDDKDKADAHMRALYAHVEDVQKVQALLKQEGSPTSNKEDWEKWKKALLVALLLGLFGATEEFAIIENGVWVSRGYDPLTYDAETLIEDYQRRTGHPLNKIAEMTFAAIERIIFEWYMSGLPFADLMHDLERWFNDTRINLIASTETGNLLSQMVLQQMVSYGIKEWYWDHKGEDVPCTNPITILGNTYAGCLELNGKIFPIGAPMPPDAAHPNCHCLPTPKENSTLRKGGQGSGNFGHEGRPGLVGGSGEGNSQELIDIERNNLKQLEMGYKSATIQTIPISLLYVTEEGRKIPQYQEGYKRGDKFPPIAVVQHGNKYEIVDGNKRFMSAKENGNTHMEAMVLEGYELFLNEQPDVTR